MGPILYVCVYVCNQPFIGLYVHLCVYSSLYLHAYAVYMCACSSAAVKMMASPQEQMHWCQRDE